MIHCANDATEYDLTWGDKLLLRQIRQGRKEKIVSP
jgi:hypothetical protein